jgi:hypothetical protein
MEERRWISFRESDERVGARVNQREIERERETNGVGVMVCGRREYRRRETWWGRWRRKKEDGETVRENETTVGERVEKKRGAWEGEREWEKVLFGFWRERGTCVLHALEHMSIAWRERGTLGLDALRHMLSINHTRMTSLMMQGIRVMQGSLGFSMISL